MGLGFVRKKRLTDRSSGDCNAGWSYHGFYEFRKKLAKEIGIDDLESMEGFGGDNPWDSADDIIPLLNHSDCDGHLDSHECLLIAPRLRELVSKWPDDDYDKATALELADCMEKAAANYEFLIFC